MLQRHKPSPNELTAPTGAPFAAGRNILVVVLISPHPGAGRTGV